MLARWCNSKDKQFRLLAEWHEMSLTLAMEKSPDEVEVAVFPTSVSRLMSLPHHLHTEYHSDRQLRDRLLNAVHIPAVRDSLRERTPCTAHQLINRVGNRLLTERKTAGSISAHVATREPYHPIEEA